MSSDVLFIIHDNFQGDNQFPLNIGYLAAVLENAGYSIETYCMDVYHYTNKDLAKKLQENEYKVIGLNFLAARFRETIIDLCITINKYKKNAWFVLGGHCVSAIPGYMLKETKCDIIVVGEGEEVIIDIMKNKENNLPQKHIIYSTPIKDLDSLPYPAWHLFPMDIYTTNIVFPGMETGDKSFQMITSRGCINSCTFCMRITKGIRLRKLEDVINELKILNKKYRINVIRFQDELFLISKKRIQEFAKLLKDNNLKIKFTANARVDIIDEELAILLKDIGCILLNVGFESSSQEVLNHIKKNTTIEQNEKVLKICKKIGIGYGLNFIWGYPEDTKETLMNNVRLIKKYNTYMQLRTIRPVVTYPGCGLYYEAISKGLLKDEEDFFNKFKNSDLITVNFTRYTDGECYKMLFDANVELIKDYYSHSNLPLDITLIDDLYNLYFEKDVSFRGIRHYNRE
ncbi:MAG: B12-binding domain-containing radical SAM protein [Actinobacteria bacterium]|nr:B12-binding domain-containing radical SAM protein [Actinomycetota bacterium]MBE3114632.1 B12-binding domain-containing radical SAM protein [Actinomycetota bacterium]